MEQGRRPGESCDESESKWKDSADSHSTEAQSEDDPEQSNSLAEKIAEAETELAALDATLAKLQSRVRVSEAMLKSQRNELDLIRGSVSWLVVERIQRWDRNFFSPGTMRGRLSDALKTKLRRFFPKRAGANRVTPEYEKWMAQNEPTPRQLRQMTEDAKKFVYQPLVSIVVPAYKTPPDILRAAIESVRNQIYERWQLCIADDGSNDPGISRLISEFATRDRRIVFQALPSNQGIAAATNEAISIAQGEFVGFLDHDDELAPDALYWLVKLLNEDRDADLVYSDEDKLNIAGKRCDPLFKPDWSPDLLLSCNYACHFLVVRKQLLSDVRGIRSGFEGAQDWDLELRLIERTQRIRHIPRVLYHWRAIANSTASGPEAKPKAHVAQERAINEYLSRNGAQGHGEPGCSAGFWNVRYEIEDWAKVAIIVATNGESNRVQQCCERIIAATHYSNYEILVVDNSKSADVKIWAEKFGERHKQASYIDCREKRFTYGALRNLAAQKTTAPLILFLDEQIRAEDDEWLAALVEQGQRTSVGAVGAKLLYPNGTIEHAGMLTSLFPAIGHAFRHFPEHSRHYFCFPQIIRNCNAVSGACMLTKRSLFLETGGFEDRELPDDYASVDYCLRLRSAGYRVVYTPLAVLTGNSPETAEKMVLSQSASEYLRSKWGAMLLDDPYYGPNLTRKTEDYKIRLE